MDPDLRMQTVVTGTINGDHTVFSTNFWYFAAAALV